MDTEFLTVLRALMDRIKDVEVEIDDELGRGSGNEYHEEAAHSIATAARALEQAFINYSAAEALRVLQFENEKKMDDELDKV